MYDDEDDYYGSEPNFDYADSLLRRFFEDNVQITDPEILQTLHSRYSGDDEKKTGYRGMLFNNEIQTQNFHNSVKEGVFSHFLTSSISNVKRIANEFAHTQKTYNDMSMARASMAGLKAGETVSGYEGVLIEIEYNAKDCIDLSRAGLCTESELLLLPNKPAKILSIERKIPLRRQFAERMITIDECLQHESNQSTPEFNYIINNFLGKLTENQIVRLCELSEKERLKDFKQACDSNNISIDLFKKAEKTGEVQLIKHEEKRSLGEKYNSYIYIHPNGTVLQDHYSDTPLRGGSRKWVLEGTLCAFSSLPILTTSLAKDGVLTNVKGGEILNSLKKMSDSICQAIIDVTKLAEFKCTEIEHNTLNDIRDFSSPIMLEIVANAMNPDKGKAIRALNDNAHNVSTWREIREHNDKVAKELVKLGRAIEIGKPSNFNPFK
ncbi:hypothetical protein [Photobacterium kishitanii]|uniref:Uncharacterized protein n=1 Tax=Photobacterium kishitanii TaxID=318456 RepID=A0A2T3KLH8_9GAMM|nr:hypothetical protein [Photobacterium kishitanii]PSV00574.1 hypothetical protein C9J27_05410 [Photobacterium kishitanii]